MNYMTFTEWTDNQFHQMAASYRMQLSWIITEVKSYGGKLSPEQVTMVHGLLERVPVPVIEKYPHSVSDEEKEWYKACHKPDWSRMLEDAANDLAQLAESSEGLAD